MTVNATTMKTRRAQVLGLLCWLGAVFVVAAVGAWGSAPAGSFYQAIERPSWAPPAWVFGPVWTVLYAMMGVSAWLVWRLSGEREVRRALMWFLAQLAANGLWSWLFFGWKLGMLSFIDIVLLWALILATMVAFWRIKPLAGAMLIPYLLWVSFAAALNFAIWRLNPAVL